MTHSNRIKNLILLISAASVVIISFFLPQLILTLQDKNYSRGYEQVQVDDIGLSLISDLSPIEKLSFAAQPASTVELETGRYLDADSADQIVLSFFEVIGLYSGLWDSTSIYYDGSFFLESSFVGLNMLVFIHAPMIVKKSRMCRYTWSAGTVSYSNPKPTTIVIK